MTLNPVREPDDGDEPLKVIVTPLNKIPMRDLEKLEDDTGLVVTELAAMFAEGKLPSRALSFFIWYQERQKQDHYTLDMAKGYSLDDVELIWGDEEAPTAAPKDGKVSGNP